MNSIVKHTPGPWSAYEQSFPHEILICTLGPCSSYDSPVKEQIAWTAKNSWDTRSEKFAEQKQRDRANARLIAASPELLVELRKAESFISGFEDDELQEGIAVLLAGIRTAIAKAEDRS